MPYPPPPLPLRGQAGALTTTFQYAYDPVGNRTTQTATITSTQVTNYVYDAANRLASVNGQAYTWDDNGNLLNDGSKTYTYDQANRLTNITAAGLTWNASYNGEGARSRQVSNGTMTTYTLDLAAPLVQVLVAKDSNSETRYLYGVTRIGEQQVGGWVYHLTDALGSVRQLAEGSGNVMLARGYTPYGEPLWMNGTASSRYAFTGEDYDPAVGLVFLRARYMQPRLGMFLARDPSSGVDIQPWTYNGFNYASSNPINLSDPTGFQSLPGTGLAYFAKCIDLHTLAPGFGIQGDMTTAEQAVNICKAAYSAANWNKDIPVIGFQLGQELPATAHELFGWFVHDWRGRFNSDRLYFDANQPLTREVLRTMTVNDVREKYYMEGSDIGKPTEYQFDKWQYIFASLDMIKSFSQGSLPISEFMGSFWYQVRTLPDGRVGFRIDNDTTLSSGTHVVERHKPSAFLSVEDLIADNQSLANLPVNELIRKEPSLISILKNRTRAETGGRGGGNLYQTYYWTEKFDCDWLSRFLLGVKDIQVWEPGDFKSRTVNPQDFPPQ